MGTETTFALPQAVETRIACDMNCRVVVNRLLTTAATLIGAAASAQDKTVLTTDREKASYMVGSDIAQSIAPVAPDLDIAAFQRAVDNAFAGAHPMFAVIGFVESCALLKQRLLVGATMQALSVREKTVQVENESFDHGHRILPQF